MTTKAAFRLGDIRPNPFRNTDHYPIRAEKIEALRASIQSTGFWDNIVARLAPDGVPEIAYGHHRLEALRQEFDADTKVSLIVKPFDDAQMLRVMANENMQEWGSSASVQYETIRAVVNALAEGKIGPFELPPKARGLRIAPSFMDLSSERSEDKCAYTAEAIRAFLGDPWRVGQVQDALNALAAAEEGLIEEDAFSDASPYISAEFTSAARVTEKMALDLGKSPDEAKAAAKEVSSRLASEYKAGELAYRNPSTKRQTTIHDRRGAILAEVLPLPSVQLSPPEPIPYREAEKECDYLAAFLAPDHLDRLRVIVQYHDSPSLRTIYEGRRTIAEKIADNLAEIASLSDDMAREMGRERDSREISSEALLTLQSH